MDNDQKQSNPQSPEMKEFADSLKSLMERLNIEVIADLDFPLYRQVPVEVALALEVIKKHQGKMLVIYREKKEPKTIE